MEESEAFHFVRTLIPFWIIILIIAVGIIILHQHFQRRLVQQRLEREKLKNQYQQELLRTSITVQEQERQRIAHDLHDELGARLSMMLMQLKQVQEEPQTKAQALGNTLPQLQTHLEEALTSTKRISYELMPSQLVNLGLYKALQVLVADARKAGNLTIALTKSGELEPLSWPIQLGLYRMISEMLHNTLKHAKASTVTITLQLHEAQIQCRYHDNGIGLPAERPGQGLGLQSLEGRATALGGTIDLQTAPEGGFLAIVTLPLASS